MSDEIEDSASSAAPTYPSGRMSSRIEVVSRVSGRRIAVSDAGISTADKDARIAELEAALAVAHADISARDILIDTLCVQIARQVDAVWQVREARRPDRTA